jgi:hypothetical protein
VSIICPKGKGYDRAFESIDGIDIHRHSLPLEADGALGYAVEYFWAFCAQMFLSLRVALRGGGPAHRCSRVSAFRQPSPGSPCRPGSPRPKLR